jgi:hypothetical protein
MLHKEELSAKQQATDDLIFSVKTAILLLFAYDSLLESRPATQARQRAGILFPFLNSVS